MARPLRIAFAGAVYHMMPRGNQGRAVCQDEADRKRWVASLQGAEVVEMKRQLEQKR